MKKLSGGRFRQLNEDLYTSSGAANFARFSKDPELAVWYAARMDARRTAPNVPYAWSRSTTVDANASAWLAAPFSRTQ